MDVLIKNGEALERVHVDGPTAVVGRAAHCDVVVPESYVSKQHLKIFQGVVVLDLGSANGSFVDDEPLTGPVLLGEQCVRLGRGDVTLRVEVDDEDDPLLTLRQDTAADADAIARLEAENGRLTQRLAELDEEAHALRDEVARLRALRETDASRPAIEVGGAGEPSREPPGEPPGEAPGEAPGEPGGDAGAETTGDGEPVPEPRSDLVAARRAIQEMRARLRKIDPGAAKPASQPKPPASQRPAKPKRTPAASGSTPATESIPARGPGHDATADLIARLAHEDVLGVVLGDDSSLHDFLILEAFRFLRRVEKVVTRMAGELIQLYQLNTILPDVEANLRTALRELAAQPDDPQARAQLTDYLHELGRWLIVALGSYRKAAARFADVLREDLSEEALTRSAPIRGLRNKEAELWRRACQYLQELTPDFQTERIEKYAREAADEIVGAGGEPSL